MYTTNKKQNWCFDDIRIKPKYCRLLWPFQLFLHFVFPLKLYRFAQSNAQGSFAAQCDTLLAYILFLPSYRSLSPPLTVCQEPFFLGFSTFRKKKVFAEGEIVIYFQRQKKTLRHGFSTFVSFPSFFFSGLILYASLLSAPLCTLFTQLRPFILSLCPQGGRYSEAALNESTK